MTCFVCLARPAVSLVTITHLDGSTTHYRCCDPCEPRHIPHGDVVTIHVQPLTLGEPGE